MLPSVHDSCYAELYTYAIQNLCYTKLGFYTFVEGALLTLLTSQILQGKSYMFIRGNREFQVLVEYSSHVLCIIPARVSHR